MRPAVLFGQPSRHCRACLKLSGDFLYEKSDDRELVTMTLDDCDHYDEKQKEQIAESYGEHEREARTKGIPTMGSGRIFPIAQDRIACDHRTSPLIGRASVAWISAGPITLPLANCMAIATTTSFI